MFERFRHRTHTDQGRHNAASQRPDRSFGTRPAARITTVSIVVERSTAEQLQAWMRLALLSGNRSERQLAAALLSALEDALIL